MDTIVSVLSASPSAFETSQVPKQLDADLKDHAQAVKTTALAHRAVIAANAGQLLAGLDSSANSIAYLAVLQICLDPVLPPAGIERPTLLDHTLTFLQQFNPHHIRYAGTSFRTLLELVSSGKVFPPPVAVEALSNAISRLDPSGTMFTSTHLSLVKFAHDKSCIEPALRIINSDITSYPGMAGQKDARYLCERNISPASFISVETGLTAPIKSTTVLEYNMLCGLCHIALRDWDKAHQALERVITHPLKDKGTHKIIEDAYKRWVLVGLLKDGKESAVPAHTAPSVKNAFTTAGAPYLATANLFSQKNAAQFKSEVQTHHSVWGGDGTLPLINEVIAAYPEWQIIKLRHIYQQISIAQIRRIILSAETGEVLNDDGEVTRLVQAMIDSKLLKGQLLLGQSGEDSYLVFQDEDSLLSEADFAQEIARCQLSIESTNKQYKSANERLSSSKEYIRHYSREQKRAEKEGADAGVAFDSQIEDEDLMTGIMAHG